MRDKIIDYYKTLLAVGWLKTDEDGAVYYTDAQGDRPATIGGKRLVLPTRAQMASPKFDEMVRFHPLREHINLGVSDVLSTFNVQVSNRLSTSLQYVMKAFIDLAADQDVHKTLTSQQGQVLNVLSKVDAKTKDRFKKSFDELTKKMQLTNGVISFVNIYIKRGGTVGGQAYNRVGIATFPLYKELAEGKKVIAGCKLANDDRDQLRALYEFIFPSLLTDPEWYNVGVNTRTAPNLEAFVRVTIRLIQDLVQAAAPYVDVLPGLQAALDFPENLTDWIDLFDDKNAVEKAAHSIPSQKGNEGATPEEERETERRKDSDQRRHRESDDRDNKKEDVRESERTPEPTAKPEEPKKRGIMRIGNPTPDPVSGVVKPPSLTPTQSGLNHSEIERIRRENQRRREEQEEEDREYRRRRERDRDYDDDDRRDSRRGRDRDRDRDYDDDRRDRRDSRDRDRDRDRERRGGAWDNPVLARNLDDARDDERYGRRGRDRDYDDDRRGRGRDRYDDRDDRYSRRRR